MSIINKNNKHGNDKFRRTEEKGNGYRIRYSENSSDVAIIAIHGGGIEPGTSEIAEAIAGNEYSFYTFEGTLKKENYKNFHTPSHKIKEPNVLRIVQKSERVISIHGCDKEDKKRTAIFLGGLDDNLRDKIQKRLEATGFNVEETPPDLLGKDEDNICNRSKNRLGVQIEIQDGLRSDMFDGNHKTKAGRKKLTSDFYRFIEAIREAIKETD